MKKVLVFLLAALVLLSVPVYANYIDKSTEKVKQGIGNLFTGWLEVPYQTVKGFRDGLGEAGGNKFLGGFFGIFRGLIHAGARMIAGVYEIVTSPLPNPKDNEGIGVPFDAQYVWEKGRQYSIAKEGVRPMGKKFMRGLINTGLCWIDFPAQLCKGFRSGHPFKGIGRSVLYPAGRLGSGLYDLITFPIPNDAGSYGEPLTEKQPWDAFSQDKYDNGL